jgi:hypothetical protein
MLRAKMFNGFFAFDLSGYLARSIYDINSIIHVLALPIPYSPRKANRHETDQTLYRTFLRHCAAFSRGVRRRLDRRGREGGAGRARRSGGLSLARAYPVAWIFKSKSAGLKQRLSDMPRFFRLRHDSARFSRS